MALEQGVDFVADNAFDVVILGGGSGGYAQITGKYKKVSVLFCDIVFDSGYRDPLILNWRLFFYVFSRLLY